MCQFWLKHVMRPVKSISVVFPLLQSSYCCFAVNCCGFVWELSLCLSNLPLIKLGHTINISSCIRRVLNVKRLYLGSCGRDCAWFDVQHCPCHARSQRDIAEWHTRVSPCMSDLLFMCWRGNIREPVKGFSATFHIKRAFKIYFNIRILLVIIKKNNGNVITNLYVRVNCSTCKVNDASGASFAAEIQVLASAMFLLTFTQSSNLRSCGVIQWHEVRSRWLESRWAGLKVTKIHKIRQMQDD